MPTLINDLNNQSIVDISCGYDFSLCIDENGELIAFGQNTDHQLGFLTKVKQKTSLNGVNNLLENKKLKLFKSKKVLTMLSSKQIEKLPVRVEFKGEETKKLSYLDSLTIDFTTLKRQKKLNRKQEEGESMGKDSSMKMVKLNENLEFNNFSLSKIIFELRHELDLRLILNTCLSMDSYLCCGFINELLKEPLNALEYYLKAAFSNQASFDASNGDSTTTINHQQRQYAKQIKEILNYFIAKYMTSDKLTFKLLIIKFFDFWLVKYTIEALELLLIEIYEEKVNNFIFGLFLFELMESDELQILFSNKFKIKLMKITCKYLKSANINEFMVEPATSLLSSISSNQNLLSAEKLWKNILNNIQQELDKSKKNAIQSKKKTNVESMKLDEQQTVVVDDSCELNEGIELIPEDNKIVLFSCNHHFNTDYFSSILLKQIEIINSDIMNKASNSSKLNAIDFNNKTNLTSRCPLCSI